MDDGLREIFQKGKDGMVSGDYEKACGLFGVALERCEKAEDRPSAAHARRLLGDVETLRGNFDNAGAHYMKALEFLLKSADLNETAECLRGLGYLHWRKGDFNMANEYLSQGLERALKADNKAVQGHILTDMGNVACSQGKSDAGERLYKQAVDTLKDLPNSIELDRATMNLGDIYMNRGDLAKAASQFEMVVAQARKIKDGGNLSWSLVNLAECSLLQGDRSQVEDLLVEAKALMSESSDRVGLAATKRVMGQLEAASKDWVAAEAEFESALADYQEMDMPERRAVVLRLYGEMLVEKGDRARARTMLEMSMDLFEELGSERELEATKAIMDRAFPEEKR